MLCSTSSYPAVTVVHPPPHAPWPKNSARISPPAPPFPTRAGQKKARGETGRVTNLKRFIVIVLVIVIVIGIVLVIVIIIVIVVIVIVIVIVIVTFMRATSGVYV